MPTCVLDAQHCAWCQLSTVWLSARANSTSGKQQVEIIAQLQGHTYIHPYIHPSIHTYNHHHPSIHTYMHAYIHTYTHAHKDTITHTITHTYMCADRENAVPRAWPDSSGRISGLASSIRGIPGMKAMMNARPGCNPRYACETAWLSREHAKPPFITHRSMGELCVLGALCPPTPSDAGAFGGKPVEKHWGMQRAARQRWMI